MEFKKLEFEPESGKIKRIIQSAHFKKSLIFIVIGALAGFLYFYLTEGRQMNVIASGDIIKSLLIGGFLGYFITNSPCTRGKC